MIKYARLLAALAAVLFAVVALSACGGIPSNDVVKVEGNPISKASFQHWLRSPRLRVRPRPAAKW